MQYDRIIFKCKKMLNAFLKLKWAPSGEQQTTYLSVVEYINSHKS